MLHKIVAIRVLLLLQYTDISIVEKLPLKHYFDQHQASTLAFLSEVLVIPTGDVIILDANSTLFIDILIYYASAAVDQSGLYIIKNVAVFLSNQLVSMAEFSIDEANNYWSIGVLVPFNMLDNILHKRSELCMALKSFIAQPNCDLSTAAILCRLLRCLLEINLVRSSILTDTTAMPDEQVAEELLLPLVVLLERSGADDKSLSTKDALLSNTRTIVRIFSLLPSTTTTTNIFTADNTNRLIRALANLQSLLFQPLHTCLLSDCITGSASDAVLQSIKRLVLRDEGPIFLAGWLLKDDSSFPEKLRSIADENPTFKDSVLYSILV